MRVVLTLSLLYLIWSPDLSDQKCTAEFEKVFLTAHNKYRAVHSASGLILDPTISAVAQQFAEKLLAQNALFHSQNPNYGENLYAVYEPSKRPVDATTVVTAWYNERDMYTAYGKEPNLTEYQKWTHFTQVVWVSTTKIGVGCAISPTNTTTFVVANYSPFGNIVGKFTSNVLRPKT